MQNKTTYLFALLVHRLRITMIMTSLLAFSSETASAKGNNNGIDSSFTGSLIQNKVQLSWFASNEKEVSHYVIEKSHNKLNSIDIVLFFTSDDDFLNKTYRHKEQTQSNHETVYYRLKTVSKTGMIQYSKWLAIKATSK